MKSVDKQVKNLDQLSKQITWRTKIIFGDWMIVAGIKYITRTGVHWRSYWAEFINVSKINNSEMNIQQKQSKYVINWWHSISVSEREIIFEIVILGLREMFTAKKKEIGSLL